MKEVNIAMVMDVKYLLPTSVTMFSAIANKNKDSQYNFYIISDKFNVDICRKLRAFQTNNVNVNLIEYNALNLAELHDPNKNSYCVASPTALLKFKIPDLVKDKEKVLYIDGDLVVRSDLHSLYSIDIGDNLAGVIQDSGSLYSGNKVVKSFKNYFNSGVMLLNAAKLREEKASAKLFQLKKNSKNENLMDQNIFNEYFDKRVKLLPIVYNCLYVNLVRSRSKFTITEFNTKFGTEFKDLKDLAQKAVIVHYSSKDKPWRNSNIPLANEWLNYYYQYCSKFGFDSSELLLTPSTSYRNDRCYLPEARPKIIVSLTTYPGRIGIVHLPILDMINQTISPDLIVLYLSTQQFPDGYAALPTELKEISKSKKLVIKFVDDDIRAHKKYYYAFEEYAGSLIVTIDDDLRFDRFMIERLIIAHYKHPRAIIATRVHLITGNLKSNTINSYSDWRKEYDGWINIPSHQLFATHGAGTLFPPYAINLERLRNIADIKELCLLADDIWLKVNEVLSNTKIVLAAPHSKLELIDNSQDTALWKVNVTQNLNDKQLDSLLQKYNKINSKDSIVQRIFRATPYPNMQVKEAKTKNNVGKTIPLKEPSVNYEDEYYRQKKRCDMLKKSVSYRIGRAITFIPRFIIRTLKVKA